MSRSDSAKNRNSSRVKQYDVALLAEDINPSMKKGTKVVILEIYDNGDAFEIEAVKDRGTNVVHQGRPTFTVSKNQIKPLK